MAAYAVEHQLVEVLLKPAEGQKFIYTSPLGGMNFLFGVCLDIGIALSIPLIVYQVLRFIEPLMHRTTTRFVMIGSLISGVVAIVGILFGYFFGLPAALDFLMHQFTTAQVKPLLTIQSYLSFVTIYLLGAALMFQLPLFMIFINRIKPLKPSKLFKYERHMIVAAFVIGFIMNPTPNLIDQLLVVLPIILSYQLGIGIVWFINRGLAAKLDKFAEDTLRQAERNARLAELKPVVATPVGRLTDLSGPLPRPVSRANYMNDVVAPRRPVRPDYSERASG
jgi:sec-independent protein translocase protein TatC